MDLLLQLRLTSTCKSWKIREKKRKKRTFSIIKSIECLNHLIPRYSSSISSPAPKSYLHFDVADFVDCPQDRPSHHRGEYVGGEVASSISAFDELKGKGAAVSQGLESSLCRVIKASQAVHSSSPDESPPTNKCMPQSGRCSGTFKGPLFPPALLSKSQAHILSWPSGANQRPITRTVINFPKQFHSLASIEPNYTGTPR